MIWRRLRGALTRPIDPVLWAFDWRAWAVTIAAIAIVNACIGCSNLPTQRFLVEWPDGTRQQLAVYDNSLTPEACEELRREAGPFRGLPPYAAACAAWDLGGCVIVTPMQGSMRLAAAGASTYGVLLHEGRHCRDRAATWPRHNEGRE